MRLTPGVIVVALLLVTQSVVAATPCRVTGARSCPSISPTVAFDRTLVLPSPRLAAVPSQNTAAQDPAVANPVTAEEALGLDARARELIQEGLRTLGIDPGPTDGTFGPRTRDAIRRWQVQRGLLTTGYLDPVAADALWRAGIRQPVADPLSTITQEPKSDTSESSAPEPPNRPIDEQLGQPPPGEVCGGQRAGAACWMPLTGNAGCYVWNPNLQIGETVSWDGNCEGNVAHGRGSLTWSWGDDEQTGTGELRNGRVHGHWVFKYANGTELEGNYLEGELQGPWVQRR